MARVYACEGSVGNGMIISQKGKKRRIGERELKGPKFGEEAIATGKR